MSDIYPQYKKEISKFLTIYLQQKEKDLTNVNEFGKKTIKQLLQFTLAGKMIRGSIILFTHDILKKKVTNDTLHAAAAIELIHSGLLIHDDIIDNDSFRRGKKTIAKTYEDYALKNKFISSLHFGNSIGICVADISFFLGLELLSNIKDKNVQSQIIALCTKEFIQVGTAQMQDIYMGYTNKNDNIQTIENMYRFKTARYTISLPLMIGAILIKKSSLIKPFEELGEELGLLFQLTDDKLNFFGSDLNRTATDIRENKKTFYRFYLYSIAKNSEQKKLNTIFGNKKSTNEDINFVTKLMEKYAVNKSVDKKIEKYKYNAVKIIDNLTISKKDKNNFLTFVEFLTNRNC